eukprot:1134094-Pleurochrysis_carterae.AAC.1
MASTALTTTSQDAIAAPTIHWHISMLARHESVEGTRARMIVWQAGSYNCDERSQFLRRRERVSHALKDNNITHLACCCDALWGRLRVLWHCSCSRSSACFKPSLISRPRCANRTHSHTHTHTHIRTRARVDDVDEDLLSCAQVLLTDACLVNMEVCQWVVGAAIVPCKVVVKAEGAMEWPARGPEERASKIGT